MVREFIKATYQVSGSEVFDVEKRAHAVALGQTTDTWTPLEALSMQRLERHRGVVLGIGAAAQEKDRYWGEKNSRIV